MIIIAANDRKEAGRLRITTSESEITKKNIGDVLSKAFAVHNINVADIKKLREYYKGKQDILNRKKAVREEICNVIVENRAYEIVEFKKGYVFGEPIQFVQSGDNSQTAVDEMSPSAPESVQILNRMMSSEGKESVDITLGEDLFVCGTAFRFCMPKKAEEIKKNESPFRICALDPENTFIVYSSGPWGDPVLGVNYIDEENEDGITKTRKITAYTKTKAFELSYPSDSTEIGEDATIEETSNGVGAIPIIEYPANQLRIGCFEPVICLLDAINTIASNRVDGIEQFVQSFIKFTDCDLTEKQFDDLKKRGALILKGIDGRTPDAEILESSLDQQQTQKLVDHEYQAILTICGVPDREASAGGNTGQALIIGQGWASAESRAKSTETMFRESERMFLKVVLNILRATEKTPEEMKDLKIDDITIKFTRNRTDSLLVKTQGLQNLLEAGVHPRIALSTIGLFSDPEQVYSDSVDYLDKWLQSGENAPLKMEGITPGNNKSEHDGDVKEPTTKVTA